MATKLKDTTVIEKAAVVSAGVDQPYTMTPSDGAEVFISKFVGSHTLGMSATICCTWDYGGAGEVIVDVVNSGIKKHVATGDGSKKLALIFSNQESVDDVAFASTVVVVEETDG